MLSVQPSVRARLDVKKIRRFLDLPVSGAIIQLSAFVLGEGKANGLHI
jgi:hypothetical protein